MSLRPARAPLVLLALALPLACGNDPQLSPLPDDGDAGVSDAAITPPSLACLANRIALGPTHSCALLVSGQVYCWGSNGQGELGQNDLAPSATPRPVLELPRPAVQVTAARHRGCARLVDGSIACWGTVAQSNPEAPEVRLAFAVALPGTTAQVAAGGGHVCALLSDDSVRCWGQPGRVGDGVRVARPEPVPVPGLDKGVLALAAATDYTCALLRAGTVTCWGDIDAGLLDAAAPAPGPALIPVAATRLGENVTALAAGPELLCALYRDGRIGCLPGNEPVIAGLGKDNQALAVGQRHVCALNRSGAIACFGSNDNGQIGSDPRLDIPAATPLELAALGKDNRAVAAGLAHTCALKASGAVVCWGRGSEGQLGQGAERGPLPASPDPVPVAFPSAGCP